MEVILKISTFIALLFQCLSGYFCQDRFENVALNKKCNISSIWYGGYDNPQFAVNNNTDGLYGDPPTNCIHTGPRELNPWWEVDLGRPYPVSSITVWARLETDVNSGIGKMSGCVITVNREVCYTFPTLPKNSSRKLDVNCTSGIINGSKVRVSKSSSTDIYIIICEFQVWSCRDPYWGKHCENNCGHCADGVVCDKINGHCICSPGFKPPFCVDVCDNGTYGQNCSSKCSENCDGVCDKKTGTCSCKPGWKTQSQFCDAACDDGTYGQNCSLNCGNCTNNHACNKVVGYCPSCQTGFIPPLCQKDCSAGKYGQDCKNDCGRGCNNIICHSVTGHCECVAGWQPPMCQQAIGQMNVGHIDGTVVGLGVAVAVLIIIVIVLLIRDLRRPKDSRHHTMTSTEIEIHNSQPPSEQWTDNADHRENAYDRLDRQEIYENAKERSVYMDLTSSQTHAVLKS